MHWFTKISTNGIDATINFEEPMTLKQEDLLRDIESAKNFADILKLKLVRQDDKDYRMCNFINVILTEASRAIKGEPIEFTTRQSNVEESSKHVKSIIDNS